MEGKERRWDRSGEGGGKELEEEIWEIKLETKWSGKRGGIREES